MFFCISTHATQCLRPKKTSKSLTECDRVDEHNDSEASYVLQSTRSRMLTTYFSFGEHTITHNTIIMVQPQLCRKEGTPRC